MPPMRLIPFLFSRFRPHRVLGECPPRPACLAGVASHVEQATTVPLAGQRAWAEAQQVRPHAVPVVRPRRGHAALHLP